MIRVSERERGKTPIRSPVEKMVAPPFRLRVIDETVPPVTMAKPSKPGEKEKGLAPTTMPSGAAGHGNSNSLILSRLW
jgi:hypothetical protein